MRRTLSVLYSGLILFLAMGALWGQGTTSRVTGNVQDQSGALIPGATVTLTNEATQVAFITTTTSAGNYTFDSVQVGIYTVAVEASGFRRFVSTGNVLAIGQPMTVNASLTLGDVSQTVEVSGAQELVQTSTSGNFGNVVEQRLMVDLPIVGSRGRNPLDFVLFQPGVASGANTGGGVHVHGARDRAWNFTLDGIDVNETSAGGSNFSPLRTNPDSIGEFAVLTGNFTAEYGRNSGGQVTQVTRSGTNDFHGTLFWFYQTPRLHANEYENTINRQDRPQFVQHIPGFNFGGPIIKNKTFFFTNVQWLRTRQTRSVTSAVYTEAARRGLFRYVRGGQNRPAGTPGASVDAAGNVLPGVNVDAYSIAANDPLGLGLDPQIQSLINLTPLPNNFAVGDGLNTAGYTWSPIQREKQADWTLKVDQTINARNTLFVRYAQGGQDTAGDFGNNGWSRFPGTPRFVDTERRPRNLATNWRWSPTSRVTNEFVIGFNYFRFNFINPDPSFANRPPFALNDVDSPYNNARGNLRALTTHQLVDNFTYVRGPHTLRTGVNFRYQRHLDVRGSVAGLNVQPEVAFGTGFAPVDQIDFRLPSDINATLDDPRLRNTINNLLGRMSTVSQAFVAVGDRFAPPGTAYGFDARFGEYDFYWQDTWKARPNLTVDLGLRWEIKLAPRDPRNRITAPDQPVYFGAPPSETLRWAPGRLYNDAWRNLGPSVGLAWDPFGTGKTSIRVNYRLAYDRINTFVLSSSIFQNLPGQTVSVVRQGFPRDTVAGRLRGGIPVLSPDADETPLTGRQPKQYTGSNITVMHPDWKPPRTHMWGLSVQRELRRQLVLEVNYIGRRGVNLFGGYDVNQADISNNGFLEAFNTVRAGGVSPLFEALLGPGGSALARSRYGTQFSTGSVAGLAGTLNSITRAGDTGGLNHFFFVPYPQFSGGLNVLDSADFSTYHAMEVQLQRRFAAGLGFQASYTLSKSLDTRSYDPAFSTVRRGSFQSASSTPFDLRNRRINYAPSDFDRRHMLLVSGLFELPFGSGHRWGGGAPPWAQRLIGGWEAAGILRWYSGRPFTVYSGSFTVSNVVQSTASCSGCRRDMGAVRQDPTTGVLYYFDANERGTFTNPTPGSLGNTGRNSFYTDQFFNIDLTVLKRTRITERQNIELRLEMRNMTNTPSFDVPTAVVTSNVFGRLRDAVASSSRKMQVAIKYNF